MISKSGYYIEFDLDFDNEAFIDITQLESIITMAKLNNSPIKIKYDGDEDSIRIEI